MEANEMEPGTRNQGGQALEEFQGRHDDMRGAIAGLELDHASQWSGWSAAPS